MIRSFNERYYLMSGESIAAATPATARVINSSDLLDGLVNNNFYIIVNYAHDLATFSGDQKDDNGASMRIIKNGVFITFAALEKMDGLTAIKTGYSNNIKTYAVNADVGLLLKCGFLRVCDECGDCMLNDYIDLNNRIINKPYTRVKHDKNGDEFTICLGCAVLENTRGEYIICDECGDLYPADEMQEIDGENICSNCIDDAATACDGCGELHLINNMYTAYDEYGDERYFCENCTDEQTFICDDCSTRYTRSVDRYDTINGDTICLDCRNNNYMICDGCGELVHCDDIYTTDDGDDYCADCYRIKGDLLQGWHSHKDEARTFWKHSKPASARVNDIFIGIEQETDKGDSRSEYVSELNRVINADGSRAYFEKDGSLDYGVEIISEPHDLESIATYPFEKIEAIAKKYGFKAHDTNTCGLHIHFTRAILGDDAITQSRTIERLIAIMDIYKDDVRKISRRDYGRYCSGRSLCDKDYRSAALESDKTKAIKAIKATGENAKYDGRYYNVNLENKNTIEIRCTRGTIKAATIRATIDFYYYLICACRDLTTSLFYGGKDSEKYYIDMALVLSTQTDRARDYLRSRNAFTGII